MRITRALGAVLAATVVAVAFARAGSEPFPSATAPASESAVITYTDERALATALRRHPAKVLRRIAPLRAVEVRPPGSVLAFAEAVASLPGIAHVERQVARVSAAEPALVTQGLSGALQWQYGAVHLDAVPEDVLRAAASQTIAVIDTGADLAAPDLLGKALASYSVRTRTAEVGDRNGHGTFVASLAAGSTTNGDGIAGAGGDARLLIVQAGAADGSFTDVDEAAAIVWAVDHGARILNLSLGGPDTSAIERRAVDYAVESGALLVAPVGNDHERGNRIEYPAALLQPPGSNGIGGRGLAVAATTRTGERASFSNTGSAVSLAAPGQGVFAAVSSLAPVSRYPRSTLPGSVAGLYGFASGTSFAAPQVAGAAALVWAANPALRAEEVADILEQTAGGQGVWSPELGFGLLDVAEAVARAKGVPVAAGVRLAGRRDGRRVTLTWIGAPAPSWRISVSRDGRSSQILTPATTATSATYSLASGSVYRFTVAALDDAGVERELSRPWTVSLRRAGSELTLVARRAGRKVVFESLLRVAGAPAAGRTLLLEGFDGKRWTSADTATTDGAGAAAWRFMLERGAYRVRARFAGDDEVAEASSRPLELEIR